MHGAAVSLARAAARLTRTALAAITPGQVDRRKRYLYEKGTRLDLFDTLDGSVLVMRSWTPFVNKGEPADNIKDPGSQLKSLPPG